LTNPLPPAGFAPHFRSSPLTAPWEPLYSKWVDVGAPSTAPAVLVIGLHVREAHCNSRGFAHGGLIGALADNAMGLSLAAGAGTGADTGSDRDHDRASSTGTARHAGSVTVNLNIDFVGSARIGDWLEFRPRVLRRARTLAFIDCMVVTADEHLVARANATFRLG
jgi:acyl-coenzyme A thioesterase PaaI-like protein